MKGTNNKHQVQILNVPKTLLLEETFKIILLEGHSSGEGGDDSGGGGGGGEGNLHGPVVPGVGLDDPNGSLQTGDIP